MGPFSAGVVVVGAGVSGGGVGDVCVDTGVGHDSKRGGGIAILSLGAATELVGAPSFGTATELVGAFVDESAASD